MDLSASTGASFVTLDVASDPMKILERTDTPSTVCGDEELNSMNSCKIVTNPPMAVVRREAHAVSPVYSKPGRGLNCHEFMSAVKAPFLFPSLRMSPRHVMPVCIICSQGLLPGNVCRELIGCGHCFHARCVEQYFQSHSRCPVCRLRFRPSKRRARHSSVRPCWTPDYDTELMNLSAQIARENNHIYLGSGLFLGSALPTLLEENEEVLKDGSLLGLCRYLNREKERRVFASMPTWSRDMKKLSITFSLSLMSTFCTQLRYVSELTRLYSIRRKFFHRKISQRFN